MTFWTLESIRAACGGTWIGAAPPAAAAPGGEPWGVSIDSRSLRPGQVFVALRGETFDGHAFVAAAARAGARVVIVERREAAEGLTGSTPAILVGDSRAALLRLARTYRDQLGLGGTRVIAVCGSNGKTTTTRLIDAALSARLRGTCPPKSFNNAVGVPLTILAAREGDEYLVCEVGSNAPGEVAALGAMVRPDVAVITSIGREHLEGFGSLEGVAREEGSILACLNAGGSAVVTADAPLLREVIEPARRGGPRVVTFGRAADAGLRLVRFEHAGAGLTLVTADGAEFAVPMLGEHNALNALAAAGVARLMGLDDGAIARGLARATGPEMRLQRVSAGGVEFLNDAYNANPESTLAALRVFASLFPTGGAGRRVVVMGDNLELGEAGPGAHREIGREVAALGCADVLITVGPLARLAGESARGSVEVAHVATSDTQGVAAAAGMLRAGDRVLLKGSRRMGLERIIAAWREADRPAVPAHASNPETPRAAAPRSTTA